MKKGTRRIPLTQGKFAVVDVVDYEWIMQWKWFANECVRRRGKNKWYAARAVHVWTHPKRKVIQIIMHREIAKRAKFPFSKRYDHKDRNALNNCRDNIRPATASQNAANTAKLSGCKSLYKGVYRQERWNRWIALIGVNYTRIYLGCFIKEKDAAMAYAKAAKKYFGEFACTKRTG